MRRPTSTSVVTEKLRRFFSVSNRSKAFLLSGPNLLAAGLIPMDDLLARVRAASGRGKKANEGSSSAMPSTHPSSAMPSSQPGVIRPSKRARRLISTAESTEDEILDLDPSPPSQDPPAAPAPVLAGKAKLTKLQRTSQARLGDGESSSAYIEAQCKRMAAKYEEFVDLVKEPGYLQSCLDSQIEVCFSYFLAMTAKT